MIEMAHPVLFIILIVILADASLLLASAHFCATKTSCGNGSEIPPPFWIDDGRSLGEGCTNYLGFRIKCARDGTPTMNISNGLYTVLRVQTDDGNFINGLPLGLITVREAAINEQGCPQPQQKLPIGDARFLEIAAEEANIFYNCSRAPPNITVQEIPCLQKYDNNSSKHSYALWNYQIPASLDWFSHCENSALTYIDDDDDQRHSSNFVEELHKGFSLYWSTPVNCTDCVNSGGSNCSSNETTGQIACYCPHYEADPLIDGICPYGIPTGYPYIDLSIKRRIVIGVSAGVGSCLLIFLLLCIYRKRIYNFVVSYWRKKIIGLTNVEVFLDNYGYLAIQRYTYLDIKKLTNSFKETLGQGGYGSVFKGKLRDGHVVAVKVLNEAKGKGEDFINEVAAIGRTNHVNVVSLLGFCTEKNKRALVYEYMPNGSLERFIYGEKNSSTANPLGPEKLYEITLGIARGLEYLHRGCNTRILHLDIKPHNILLDQDFCPRISDFGLAKLCPTKESLVIFLRVDWDALHVTPLQPHQDSTIASAIPDQDADYSLFFNTNRVFASKKELTDWLQETGRKHHMVVVVFKSDFSKGRTPRIWFSCDRSGKYVPQKKPKVLADGEYRSLVVRSVSALSGSWRPSILLGRTIG